MTDRASDSIKAAKAAMRAEAIARRRLMPREDRALASAGLIAPGLTLVRQLVTPPATVSGFLAIGEEIDPVPLLERLLGEGYALALPVMAGKGKPLIFRAWAPGQPLATATWGIREPGADAPAVSPDVVLVPLLVFDACGHRLGYGGGFYDRTLRNARAAGTVHAVGLAFGLQKVDAVPHLDYDETLDWVLTPEGPMSPRPRTVAT